jgi:hypothetical protein
MSFEVKMRNYFLFVLAAIVNKKVRENLMWREGIKMRFSDEINVTW